MTKNNPRPRSLETVVSKAIEGKIDNSKLVEIAWEVCNQVGGIYTVIKSKVLSMMERWGDDYFLIGPYIHPNVSAIFDPIEDLTDSGPVGEAVKRMRDAGFEVHYGRWLIPGRPRVVLFNPYHVFDRLGDIKYELWDHHAISVPSDDELINQVVAFGYQVKLFLIELAKKEVMGKENLVAHIHEWMAATGLPGIRRSGANVHLVFTTHATILGRYLAMNDAEFYQHLPFYDWEKEAKKFNIDAQVRFERAAAHGSHVFSTVSQVTARECEVLLGRKPDIIVPNGLNIARYVAPHEIQNIHQEYKDEIHKFTMGHFFHSTPFNLDRTLYFFTSGRYEYRNKGFDMTLEALARLNHRMKEANMDITVVMFFITKAPIHSINPDVLQSRAMLEEIRQTATAIEQQVGGRLFQAAAESEDTKMPNLNEFIDDYWRLRMRRTLQKWKNRSLPPVVTHNLIDDSKDPILNFLRSSQLINKPEDRVKIVYHPDFIASTNPLFGIEYPEFVRGCHLGIFPSYYEPWGYTPLECMASGVPAVTSNLSGFGDYSLKVIHNPEFHGLHVINRRDLLYNDASEQLADVLFNFVQMSRRERIELRYKVEAAAMNFEWNTLTQHYDMAHGMALR